MSQHSTVDINNYFPFHALANSKLGSTTRMYQSQMDRLSQLRIIPLKSIKIQRSQTTILNLIHLSTLEKYSVIISYLRNSKSE